MASEMVTLPAKPPAPQTNDALMATVENVSNCLDGIADILGGMIGKKNELDAKLYACEELLRKLSSDLEGHML